jgi:heterodisulfide reductase subunit A-like polyferredoxin
MLENWHIRPVSFKHYQRFAADYSDGLLVIAACAPNMQYKMFRDAFVEKGMDVKKDMTPLDIRDMSTEEAVGKVASALQEMGVKGDA